MRVRRAETMRRAQKGDRVVCVCVCVCDRERMRFQSAYRRPSDSQYTNRHPNISRVLSRTAAHLKPQWSNRVHVAVLNEPWHCVGMAWANSTGRQQHFQPSNMPTYIPAYLQPNTNQPTNQPTNVPPSDRPTCRTRVMPATASSVS